MVRPNTTTTPIPAAAYLRMSTDQQGGSIEQQREHLHRYAAEHGFTIVEEYCDEGKSGWPHGVCPFDYVKAAYNDRGEKVQVIPRMGFGVREGPGLPGEARTRPGGG